VVRLSPAHPFATAEDDQLPAVTEAVASAEQTPGGAPTASNDQTRPVLKLHGAQEGKVYMRALTAADKDTTL